MQLAQRIRLSVSRTANCFENEGGSFTHAAAWLAISSRTVPRRRPLPSPSHTVTIYVRRFFSTHCAQDLCEGVPAGFPGLS
jgi:hypothetical protein